MRLRPRRILSARLAPRASPQPSSAARRVSPPLGSCRSGRLESRTCRPRRRRLRAPFVALGARGAGRGVSSRQLRAMLCRRFLAIRGIARPPMPRTTTPPARAALGCGRGLWSGRLVPQCRRRHLATKEARRPASPPSGRPARRRFRRTRGGRRCRRRRVGLTLKLLKRAYPALAERVTSPATLERRPAAATSPAKKEPRPQRAREPPPLPRRRPTRRRRHHLRRRRASRRR
mmetsp:Transcript_5574/g.20173  ORF Transcript_5574/g.20173 Transcript_5574/m.20173 type:complete len:232 (+) Transcript_5574:140-835(+)